MQVAALAVYHTVVGFVHLPGDGGAIDLNGMATASYAHVTVGHAAGHVDEAALGGCARDAIHKNHTVLVGTKMRATNSFSYPRGMDGMADALCCGISATGAGKYYTLANLGPSLEPDEDAYLCTTFGVKDDNVTFVPGNDSVSSGFSPVAPPPDPKCAKRTTLADCLKLKAFPGDGMASCVWSNNTCAYEPPIDCGGIGAAAKYGPLCMGVALADTPYHPHSTTGTPPRFPPPPAPTLDRTQRRLHDFNWTSGTISGAVHPVALPPQVVKSGGDFWYSVEVDPPGWTICVTYNELSIDGKTSDPNSAFKGCVERKPNGGVGISRGATSNLGIAVVQTLSTGWTASGHDPLKQSAIYLSYIVWSNSTLP